MGNSQWNNWTSVIPC